MKASVRRRKARVAVLGPRPTRLFRVPPTFGNTDTAVIARCDRHVGEAKASRKRWLKGKRRTVNVVCCGPVVLTRGRRGRKAYCVACRERNRDRRAEARQAREKPWLNRRPVVSRTHRLVPRVLRRAT